MAIHLKIPRAFRALEKIFPPRTGLFVRYCVTGVVLLLRMLSPHVSAPLAVAALCSAVVASAATTVTAPAEKRTFNLPRGDAATTLKQFAADAGTPIVYLVDRVRGITTHAVSGEFTPREALERMLAGTALEAAQDAATGALMIKRTPPLPSPPASSLSSPMKTLNPLRRFAGLLALALAPGLDAQTPATPARSGDETITLSPFLVETNADVGYVATSTLAGTRLNTPLRDTPIAISVFTEEFLKDMDAVTMADALQFAIGVDRGNDVTGNVRQSGDVVVSIRGLGGSTMARNYFNWSNQAADSYNIGSITFTRGPNNVLFGRSGPQGVFNVDTKRASFGRNSTELTTRFARFNSARAHIDTSRTIGKTLAVRANLLYQKEDGYREFEQLERKAAALALSWRPFAKTTIRFDGEYMDNKDTTALPWLAFDYVTPWIAAGRPMSQTAGTLVAGTERRTSALTFVNQNTGQILPNQTSIYTVPRAFNGTADERPSLLDTSLTPLRANLAGPGGSRDNDFITGGIYLEQQIGDDLFVELAANRQENFREWHRPINWAEVGVRADVNMFLPGGAPNPYAGKYFVETRYDITNTDGRNDDFRASASYDFDFAKKIGGAARWLGRHQLAGMWSRRDSLNTSFNQTEARTNNPANANVTAANNVIMRRTYFSFDDPSLPRGHLDPRNRGLNGVNGVNSRPVTTSMSYGLTRLDSALAVLQSRFLKDRLVTTVGLRNDEESTWGTVMARNPVTQEVIGASKGALGTVSSADTKTFGVVFHATDWLALRYNEADNFQPQGGFRLGYDTDTQGIGIGPRVGQGTDAGVMLNLKGGRYSIVASRFEVSEDNVSIPWGGDFMNQVRGITYALNRNFGTFAGNDTVSNVSKGYEFEMVANITPKWRMMVNYSQADVATSDVRPLGRKLVADNRTVWQANAALAIPPGVPGVSGAAAEAPRANVGAALASIDTIIAAFSAAEGQAPVGHRRSIFNAFTQYTVAEGAFKNVSFGGGVRHRGSMVTGYDAASKPFRLDAHTFVSGVVGYSHPIRFNGRAYTWKVQLNIDNLLNRRDLILDKTNAVGEVLRAEVAPPRTVSLTNRISF